MPTIFAAVVAALLALWFGGDPVVAASVAAGLALTVQAATPFSPLTEQEILERKKAREQAAVRPAMQPAVKAAAPRHRPKP